MGVFQKSVKRQKEKLPKNLRDTLPVFRSSFGGFNLAYPKRIIGFSFRMPEYLITYY